MRDQLKINLVKMFLVQNFFDAVTQEFNEKFGFRLAKPSPAWNTGVKGDDGKYIYERVRLRDIPKLADDYLATQTDYLQRQIDAYQVKLDEIQQEIDNFRTSNNHAGIEAITTGLDNYWLKFANEQDKLIQEMERGKKLLETSPQIKKYRVMLEETAYGLRLTDAKYSINKKHPSLDELKKTHYV